jgi:hypothetical protein
MNRGTMKTELQRIVGETSAYDFWPEAEHNSKLNEALRYFSFEEKWPWLLTEVDSGSLAANDTLFQFPEGISFPRNINVLLTPDGETRSYRPKRVDTASGFDLRENFDGQTAAYPMYYYLVSQADVGGEGSFTVTARFLPTPSRDFTVAYLYYRVPAEMSGDATVPDMPVEYHMGIVHKAAELLWLKELDGASKAGEQESLYQDVLAQARTDYMNDAPDTPLVAGSEEPQPTWPTNTDTFTRMRIPDVLG